MALNQRGKVRLEYDGHGDRGRITQGHGDRVSAAVIVREIMEVVSFEHLYVEKLFHGTRVEVAPNIVLDGLDTRYSKGGSRTHMHFVSELQL